MKSHEKKGISDTGKGSLFIIAAAVLWGTTGTAQGLAPETVTPFTVGAMRLVVGGAGLLALALYNGTLIGKGGWPLIPTVSSAFFVAAYQLCFFTGVQKTGVAAGTITAIGSAPIAAGLLGYFIRKERFTRQWIIATVCAIIGCVVLAGSKGSLRIDYIGILSALGAGFSYAAYTTAMKGLLENHAPDAVMAVSFCLAAAILSPVLFTSDMTWLFQPRGLAAALHLGIIATALSYWFFARGLTFIQVGKTATLSLAEPLTAGVLGVTVLGEQLTMQSVIGIVLIFTGLVVLAVNLRR